MNHTSEAANPTLLVVDDELSIQKIITFYFRNRYNVVSCYNGEEALRWIYQGHYVDAIIVDVNMPELNGPDFLNELKKSALYESIPVIFLSGVENTQTKISCLENGADDFIQKPFNPTELKARIDCVLRRTQNLLQPRVY